MNGDNNSNGNSAIEKSDRSLGAQVHKESLEYLRVAMKSPNPAIVDCALRMAERSQEHYRRQTLKLHPNVVVILSTSVGLAAVGGCWYGFTTYPTTVAWELTGCIFAVALILVVLYARLAGAVTEATFKDILKSIVAWVASHVPSETKAKGEEDEEETTSK